MWMAGVKKQVADINMSCKKFGWKGKTLRQEQEEVLSEGFEKQKASLMGGKIYTKNSRHRCTKTYIQLLAFFSFLVLIFFSFHHIMIIANCSLWDSINLKATFVETLLSLSQLPKEEHSKNLEGVGDLRKQQNKTMWPMHILYYIECCQILVVLISTGGPQLMLRK